WPFSLLKTLCVDAVSLDVGGRAGEVSFNAEDEILPLIIVANLATADESCLSELTRAGPLIIPDVSVGEVRVKLAYAGVDTDVKASPITLRLYRHHIFLHRHRAGKSYRAECP